MLEEHKAAWFYVLLGSSESGAYVHDNGKVLAGDAFGLGVQILDLKELICE